MSSNQILLPGTTPAVGSYRAFLTKPIVGLGWKAGHLYREHELVGAVLNDLEKKGYVVQWTDMFTELLDEKPQSQRLLIICHKLPGH